MRAIVASVMVAVGLKQYTDLYDFAPVGYFALSRGGAICRAV